MGAARFSIAGVVFDILSSDHALIGQLEQSFRPFLSKQKPLYKARISGENPGAMVTMRVLCSRALARSGGFLLHSAVIGTNKGAYVFFGPSGSGKTTISRLSRKKAILTDETTAIARRHNRWHAYATPFAGEFGQVKHNIGLPIKAMFSLIKDSRFGHERLAPASAAQELSYSVFLQNRDFAMINTTLQSLEMLTREVPCYALRFKANPTLWRYINGFIA